MTRDCDMFTQSELLIVLKKVLLLSNKMLANFIAAITKQPITKH